MFEKITKFFDKEPVKKTIKEEIKTETKIDNPTIKNKNFTYRTNEIFFEKCFEKFQNTI